jgi:hypothetical protein
VQQNILADFLKAVLPDLADEEFEELTIMAPTPSGNSQATSWKSST